MKMSKENQACSLELAREMQELGWEQDSIWVWMQGPRTQTPEVELQLTAGLLEDQGWALICAAYTTAELDNILPTNVTHEGTRYYLFITKTDKTKWVKRPDFYIGYKDIGGHEYIHSERDDNGASARAMMAIWLRKKGVIP